MWLLLLVKFVWRFNEVISKIFLIKIFTFTPSVQA